MKKILLATSMLAATTGFAAAEAPTVSGSARMGVVYDSVSGDTVFSSRVRVKFSMVGTTDGGLEFGASVRADQTGGSGATTITDLGADGIAGGIGADADVVTTVGNTGTTNGDSTVYIAMNGLKLTMGDVGGAADALVGQTSGVGYGPNDGLHEIGFVGTTKTAVYAEYTTGALTFGVSSGQTNTGKEVSVAAKYATDVFAVALGYEDDATGDRLSVSGSYTFGAATIKAKIAEDSDPALDTAFSLSADYVTGATTITAFYTDFGLNGVTPGVDTQHIGLGVAYDLGGGASIKGGIVQQRNNVGGNNNFADLGIVMSF